MERKKWAYAAVAFLILVSVLFFWGQPGCTRRSGSEFVGFPSSFADLADRVKPAVVNISTTSTVRIPGGPFRHFFGPSEPFGDLFKKFFGDNKMPDRELKQQSLGSGFIIDRDGYIVTNNHVVEGAEEIRVRLADGREFSARVVGRDEKTDLALIKITTLFKNLPVLPFGDSDRMRVGDWVLAVGNPFGLGNTVTQGIISGTGRVIGAGPYDDFLQTDAPINPGNSGGPLVNLKGEVIGINSTIIASGQGIGFAIPSGLAKGVLSQLREKGRIVRGWIGVSAQRLTPEMARAFGLREPKGALIGDVIPGGPAEKAGLKRGDVILTFDGKEISAMEDLPRLVASTPVGKRVEARIMRSGKEMTLTLTVERMAEGEQQARRQAAAKGAGITVDDINPRYQSAFKLTDKTGVVVVSVEPGSPADDAGVQAGDVIIELNRTPVRDTREYSAVLSRQKKGEPLLLLIKRKGQTFFVSLDLS